MTSTGHDIQITGHHIRTTGHDSRYTGHEIVSSCGSMNFLSSFKLSEAVHSLDFSHYFYLKPTHSYYYLKPSDISILKSFSWILKLNFFNGKPRLSFNYNI